MHLLWCWVQDLKFDNIPFMQHLDSLHQSCSLKARGSALGDTSLGRAALWIKNLPTHTSTCTCICAFRPCSALQSNSTFLHRVKVHLIPNDVSTHRPQRLLRLLCVYFQASGIERQSLLQDPEVSPALMRPQLPLPTGTLGPSPLHRWVERQGPQGDIPRAAHPSGMHSRVDFPLE